MAVLASIILTGCTNSVKPEAIKVENGSAVDIFSTPALSDLNNNRLADQYLREVTLTHFSLGMEIAVLGALMGNINSGDFDKENYKGTKIESLPNPTNAYFIPKAKEKISQWLTENGNGYVYKQPFYIGYATWALIYKDMNTATTMYQLKYKVLFYKRPESGNMFSAFTVAECSPTPVEASLTDWHANHYKKLTDETEKYMYSCLLELNN